MSTKGQTPTALDVPAGSEVFVIFAKRAFDLGESVAVEWWPVGSTADRAIAEAAVAGNRHARFQTFPAHEQNLGLTPTLDASQDVARKSDGAEASSDAAGECSCAGTHLPNTKMTHTGHPQPTE